MRQKDRPGSSAGQLGWASTFGAKTPLDLEATLWARGDSWEWLDDKQDTIRHTTTTIPAVRKRHGARTFYNQVRGCKLG